MKKDFAKRQWFRKIWKEGQFKGKLAFYDAICSLLTNGKINFATGACELKDYPTGEGFWVDVETEECFQLESNERTFVERSESQNAVRIRRDDNHRFIDNKICNLHKKK